MKKLLIVQPQDHCTSEFWNVLREDIMTCYENDKPIVLPAGVNYEVVELSEKSTVVQIL